MHTCGAGASSRIDAVLRFCLLLPSHFPLFRSVILRPIGVAAAAGRNWWFFARLDDWIAPFDFAGAADGMSLLEVGSDRLWGSW